jgi:hypothetical protein
MLAVSVPLTWLSCSEWVLNPRVPISVACLVLWGSMNAWWPGSLQLQCPLGHFDGSLLEVATWGCNWLLHLTSCWGSGTVICGLSAVSLCSAYLWHLWQSWTLHWATQWVLCIACSKCIPWPVLVCWLLGGQGWDKFWWVTHYWGSKMMSNLATFRNCEIRCALPLCAW